MSNDWQDFKFFDASEPNPIGKYKQPEVNPRFTDGNGYPVTDIGRTGTMTYGRYVEDAGQKKRYEEIRGCKNTERGKKFYVDNEKRDPVKTSGKRPVTMGK